MGLLLALALSLIAFRRPAQDDLAPATAGGVDAGMPASELVGVSDELRSTISAINSVLPSAVRGAWQVVAPADNRKERIAWLAHDLHAPAFLRAKRLDEARILEQAPEPLHVGVLAVRFGDCRALAEARAKVERSGRQSFALPVLTSFRMRARDHTLVFVYSETPMHESVAALLRDTNAVLGADGQCNPDRRPR